MAKKRGNLPERQVHRTTGRGGPHYPFPDNRAKTDKAPIPTRPRSPPGSGEWESDEEVGEPAIFHMEEHAPTTLPGDTPFILCEKTGKLGRSVPGGAEYEQDQAQELGFGLLDSDVESSPEEKRSRDIYMRQTRETTKDVEPDPKQGTSMEADAEKVPVVPSPAPVHEQRGGKRQGAFDAPMSEYSPEQRKEPYAFGHLEIEFDWPEDESPEQERRLNEAVKQIMRYINRSDSNKMGEDMIDS